MVSRQVQKALKARQEEYVIQSELAILIISWNLAGIPV